MAAILAIPGSLRRASINAAALRAAAQAAARDGIRAAIDDSVRRLPAFDPDLEGRPPLAAIRFRATCESAAGVLVAVPEYAFGIPGAFKNALDWTVGSGSLYRKPVTVLDVARPHRGLHAQKALALVLKAIDADVVTYAVPVAQAHLDPDGELRDPEILESLRVVVGDLSARGAATARAA